MTKPRQYPRSQMLVVPPDPRRKSPHVVICSQRSRHAPLDLVCCADCLNLGKADADGWCRHTLLVRDQLKPYWRKRARPAPCVTRQEATAS